MPSQRIKTVQFRCIACGYGISLSGELPACPMCKRRAWQREPINRALTSSAKP